MSNLLKVVTVAASSKKDGEAFTAEERAVTSTAVLAKVDELGGVPVKTVKGKDEIDGGVFVACVKAAIKEAGVGPACYAEKGRSWASLAFLAKSELKKLVATETKAAKALKAAAAAPTVTEAVTEETTDAVDELVDDIPADESDAA